MQRQTIFNNLTTDEQRELFQKAFPEKKKKTKQSPANALTDASRRGLALWQVLYGPGK